jgi:cytoskeletal protein RodZ
MHEDPSSQQIVPPQAPQQNMALVVSPPHSRRKKWIVVLAVVVALMAIGIVTCIIYLVLQGRPASTAATQSTAASATTQATSVSQTDNTSLQQDINDIDARMNQASQDQAANDTSLGDQQNQIAVPTN